MIIRPTEKEIRKNGDQIKTDETFVIFSDLVHKKKTNLRKQTKKELKNEKNRSK